MATPGHSVGESPELLLPAPGNRSPRRLLVVLHGAGMLPQAIIPLALAWQIKFRSAMVALPAAPFQMTQGGFSWVNPDRYPATAAEIDEATDALLPRLDAIAERTGIERERTVILGLTQGASLALEIAFRSPSRAGVIIGYGSRLYRVPQDGDHVGAMIRLVHGDLDSVVPADHALAAERRLKAIGADVYLERIADEAHTIGQTMINAGTKLLMDALYGERLRGRTRKGRIR